MVVVGNATSQLREHRFPNATGSSPTIGLSFIADDSDEDEPQVQPDAGPHEPPRISEWRSNLVALSQTENLYFAAYQESIYVTIPQGLKQTIPGRPDLIIDLPRSKEATRVGGYLDRLHGHSVNHVKIGYLGILEILLVACDDGDVIAFYTHSIQAAIKELGSQSGILPMFHENVGVSAWGLAIHSKSRMIAVSSNNREVVVYHFGCTEGNMSSPALSTWHTSCESLLHPAYGEMQLSESSTTLYPTVLCTVGESYSTIRGQNFRKILKLGPEGHNIPSIDFSSDSMGDAHSILATDINGNLWILEIWRDGDPGGTRRIPCVQKQSVRGHAVMGWGAMALPLHAFKQTITPERALGVAPCKLSTVCAPYQGKTHKRQFIFDVTSTLPKVDVNNKSSYHPMYGYGIGGPNTAPTPPTADNTNGLGLLTCHHQSGDRDYLLKLSNNGQLDVLDPPFLDTTHRFFEAIINTHELEEYSVLDRETMLAREGRRESLRSPLPEIIAKSLKRESERDAKSEDDEGHKGPVYYLQDKCAILRTYQDDIELIPPTEFMPATLCRKVLRQDLPMAIVHQVNYERLIFHVLIVELNLVIVGSQVGRVALITLTRPKDSFSLHGPATMFRIEHILPTYTHEIQGFRPSVPLLGIAASPLQGQQKEKKIWRLIMQYYDHSILNYELSRDEDAILVV